MMTQGKKFSQFRPDEMPAVNQAVEVAEELISNFYKLSASQMRQLNYDIKTAAELCAHEIVDRHFAQIVRYRAHRKDSLLETDADDFYKICIQDHSVLKALKQPGELKLYPFMLYIICHELIHVVRFRRFLQHFNAPAEEKQKEEIRVHYQTSEILKESGIGGLRPIFGFYGEWLDAFQEMAVPVEKTLTPP